MEGTSFTVARLGTPPNKANVDHILRPGLEGDRELFYAFLRVDLAHTVMLVEQEILTREQGAAILSQLFEIEALGPEEFPIDPEFDTFLLQVERYMIDRIGENIAGRMHTGRSRNDQGSAVDRVFARDQLISIHRALLSLQQTILNLAETHVETLMPGYTHLQHAQPTTFGHYLMRHYYTLERDLQRIEAAYARSNLNALGGAAMAGTSWPLNRDRTSELLGHDDLVKNGADVGTFDTDYPAEIAAVLSLMANNIGRLGGDLYIWSTYEFRMIEINDGLAGTSSIMPQKKNPHSLERIRGISGMAIGWFPAYQGALRNASSSDLTLAFAGDPLPDISDECISIIELMQATLETMTVNIDVMRERAGAFWSTTSHLADELVRHADISFRTAHHVVGRVVRNAIEAGLTPTEVTSTMVDTAAEETIGRRLDLDDTVIRDALDPEGFIYSRVTSGSAHPDAVRETLGDGTRLQETHRTWLDEKSEKLDRADDRLRSAAREIIDAASPRQVAEGVR